MSKFERFESIELWEGHDGGIKVHQWPEAPDAVEILSIEGYYGEFSVVISPENARVLAQALIDMDDTIEGRKE